MLKISKSIARTSLVVIVSLIALTITSCGASKVTQCSGMSKIVKDLTTSTDELTKEMETTNPDTAKGVQLMNKMAAKYQGASSAMQELNIQDEKLKSLRSRFTPLYGAYSSLTEQMLSSVKARDLQAFNKVSAKADSAAAEEKSLDKELTEYCSTK
jgi:uncharacterized protein YoxC